MRALLSRAKPHCKKASISAWRTRKLPALRTVRNVRHDRREHTQAVQGRMDEEPEYIGRPVRTQALPFPTHNYRMKRMPFRHSCTFVRQQPRIAPHMIALILAVVLSVVISASCSIAEAILYSVPWSYIEQLRKSGRPVGMLLFSLRSRIEQPITAVLTLNTIANTAGAAIAGSYAAEVLRPDQLPLFAAGFTVLILIVAEIIPKTLGVAYARQLSSVIAYPLRGLVIVLSPVIWVGGWITRLIMPTSTAPHATEDDIRAIVSLSRKAGGIQAHEEQSIRNILSLDKKHVHDIMTPRIVVFSLPVDISVSEAYARPDFWHYSRIPVYGEHNEDIVGIVMRRRIVQEVAAGKEKAPLSSIMQPVHYVLESQTLDKLLFQFLDARVHLFVVLDEYGGLAGVVSLEDVLEEILGREIVDETDQVTDLQELARQRRQKVTNRNQ